MTALPHLLITPWHSPYNTTVITSAAPCYSNFSTINASVILCGPTAILASQFEVSVLYKAITDRQILQSCRDFPSITMMAVQSGSNQARDSLGSDTGSSRDRGDERMKYNHTDRQTDKPTDRQLHCTVWPTPDSRWRG